ncbi:MAG: DAK2 domain-containing protein [Chloroflexota bacterium]
MTPRSNALSGADLRDMMAAGAACIQEHAGSIDALNVYPVPDGDTGTNMTLTLRAALAYAGEVDSSAGAVSQEVARGALLGARGNSGVIFSQFLKGFAAGLADERTMGAAGLHRALTAGADASYQAVAKPVEGTMLTVMRAAAEGCTGGTPAVALRAAYVAAAEALERTPEQLKVLAEAGVVDAGGQGVVAFLAGALGKLEGAPVPLKVAPAPADGVDVAVAMQDFLHASAEEQFGYCTQFMVYGEGLDPDAIRAQVQELAASTVVIGDENTVRVHAHAADPGPLLSLGALSGTLTEVHIESMDSQHAHFRTLHQADASRPQRALAVVAVAPGEGIAAVFRELGAAEVVSGGQSMNPPASELLAAAQRASALHVVLLPNNPNVVLAAHQAMDLSEGLISVVPTESVPQGVAALLTLNPDLNPEETMEAMEEARHAVRSGEVTVAVREGSVNGTPVQEGEAMALLERKLAATAPTVNEALAALVAAAAPADGSLITLFHGTDISLPEAREAAEALRATHTGVEVEVVTGGQPHYPYIVSFE